MKTYKSIMLSDIPFPETSTLERQVIADAISNPDAIGEVASFIFPDFFSSDERKTIWETVVGMYNRHETIDLVSVWQHTGQVFIDEIQTKIANPSTVTGLLNHARMLHVANTKKRAYFAAITIAQQSASATTSEEDIFTAADELSRKIKGDYSTVGESALKDVLSVVADETEEEQKEAAEGRSVRIPTSIPSLDKQLWGGWSRGQLIILAARPSVGKTAFMLQFAKTSAEHGNPTLIFSLEMTKPELGRRLLFSTGAVTQEELIGRSVNWGRFETARGLINSLPIFINDESRTLQGIVSRITLAVNQGRCKLALIDYLGVMQFDPASGLTFAQQIGFVTSELKAAAKRLGIPIILLVQLNRKSVEDNRPPELHDLRDSGSIEQDADVVLMLQQRFENAEAREAGDTPYVDIWIRKNRNYKKEIRIATMPNTSYTHFTELAKADNYETTYIPVSNNNYYDNEERF